MKLRNGDLALGGAQLGQVTGQIKLAQDLRCALLEPRGTDDAHPTFGSLIDGGLDDLGVYQPSIIGSEDWRFAALRIEADIRRICLGHQKAQLARAQQDRQRFGSSTLTPDELLLQVQSINMQQAQDHLLVTVSIITGKGNTITLNVPVDSSGGFLI